jgi:hypothetical protein
VFELVKVSMKLELLLVEATLEYGQKLPAKQAAQDPNRHKKPFPTAHPVFAVAAQTASGNDEMQVGMSEKVLSPGVQESQTADLYAQVFRVSTQRQ